VVLQSGRFGTRPKKATCIGRRAPAAAAATLCSWGAVGLSGVHFMLIPSKGPPGKGKHHNCTSCLGVKNKPKDQALAMPWSPKLMTGGGSFSNQVMVQFIKASAFVMVKFASKPTMLSPTFNDSLGKSKYPKSVP